MIGIVVINWLYEKMQPGNTKFDQAERMERVHDSVQAELLAEAHAVHLRILEEDAKDDDAYDSELIYNLLAEEQLLRDRAAAMAVGAIDASIMKNAARKPR